LKKLFILESKDPLPFLVELTVLKPLYLLEDFDFLLTLAALLVGLDLK